MAEIIILPPQQEPKRETVHYRPKNLQEQLLAFLNANNRKSFKEDEEYKYEPPPFEYSEDARSVVTILLDIARRQCLTLHCLKGYGKELQKACGARPLTGKMQKQVKSEGVKKYALKLSHAHHIVAKVLGYRSYEEAKALRVVLKEGQEPVVINKRTLEEFKTEFFPDN